MPSLDSSGVAYRSNRSGSGCAASEAQASGGDVLGKRVGRRPKRSPPYRSYVSSASRGGDRVHQLPELQTPTVLDEDDSGLISLRVLRPRWVACLRRDR